MTHFIIEQNSKDENSLEGVMQKMQIDIPEELRQTIQSIIVLSLNQQPKLVLPSLACTFIVALEGSIQVEVSDPDFKKVVRFDNGCFIGPHDRAFLVRSIVPAKFIVAVFYPGQFFLLFRIPCSEFKNGTMSLTGANPKEIVDPILQAVCPDRRISITCEVLMKAKQEADKQKEIYFEMFDNLFRGMLYTEDEKRVKDVCHALQVNQKRAERIFQRYVGINPKAFLRLKRYMHALYAVCDKRDELDCKRIARLCGYYDLPHMINDFKSLSGYTPSSIDKNFIRENVLYMENVWYNSYRSKLSVTEQFAAA